MQKKLIAAAVAGALTFSASAFADSANVSISGWLSAGVAKYDSTGKDSEYLVSDGRYSRIRFTGEEDLGGGMKAHFTIENRFGVDQGSSNAVATAWLNGNAGVGLQSATLGKITLGRWDVHYNEGTLAVVQDLTLNQAQPLGHMGIYTLLTSVNGTYALTPSRYNNLILWNSPVWSGFYAKAAYSTNHRGNEGVGTQATHGSDGGAENVVLGYLAGPITAGVSYLNVLQEGDVWSATNYDAKGLRGWFSYVLPFGLKLGALYDSTQYNTGPTTETKRTAWDVPVSYAFGNHVVHADYSKAGNLSVGGTDQSATGAKLMGVGYDYKLSKRTSVGVDYAKVTNDTNGMYNFFFAGVGTLTGSAVTAAGQSAKELYVGINHLF